MSPITTLSLLFAIIGASQSFESGLPYNIPSEPFESFEQQLLDHFNPRETRVWRQPYKVNMDCFKPGQKNAFVMLSIEYGGIWKEAPPLKQRLRIQCDKNVAQILLKHRFYGYAQPTGDLSLSSLQFLSSRQALEDVARFIQLVIRAKMNISAPIIFNGCSYPGALSAWLRMKYPSFVIGAIAQSAVIWAKMDFPEFEVVARNALEKEFPKCLRNLEKLYSALRKMTASELSYHLNLCNVPFSDTKSIIDGIWSSLTYTLVEVQIQYWQRKRLYRFCTKLNLDPFGAIRSYVLKEIVKCTDPTLWKKKIYPSTTEHKLECKVLPCNDWRAWFWQKCSEFGWFKTNTLANGTFFFDSLDGFLNMCHKVYLVSPEQVKANMEATNLYYGGLNLGSASKIVFTNGEYDGWNAVSLPPNDNADPMKITSLMVPKVAHCTLDRVTKKKVDQITDEWVEDYYARKKGC